MKPVHCAAVDLGATSGRVVVGSWNGRSLRLAEVHRFANQFRSMGGHEYWDLPGLWAETLAGLEKARRLFPRLASVGVDGWAVDHVLLGKDGRPVYPVHSYRDRRTARSSSALTGADLARVYELTGIPNYSYNSSLQLEETISEAPGIERVARRCLFIPDYFNFLLSGRAHNEVSIASHSQLLSARGLSWSSRALERFSVPRRWFDGPFTSPRRLGPIRDASPGLRGLLSVMVPGHDTACAFSAMPSCEPGKDLFLSSGTWSLMGIESAVPLLGRGALEAGISNERMGDGSYRPLKSCLGLWLLERLLAEFESRPRSAAGWRQLVAAAKREAQGEELLDLGDRRLFNPESMRAAIDRQLGESGARSPGGLPSYVSLICRSVAAAHAASARDLGRLSGRGFGRILIVGGGSKNPFLCQCTADSSGLPVVSYSLEGAAVGNIASQLTALGEVGGLEEFRGSLARDLVGTTYLPH